MSEQRSVLREIFFTYLRLGCVSFGGPVAHLGYFREEFVARRKWLSEAEYAELIALCQSVPGPSSSQLGFAIGWLRGGFGCALLAWLGFTLPSAALMITAAYGLFALGEGSLAYIDGLLIAAVAVVAKALLGMARTLCPDLQGALIAFAGAFITLSLPGTLGQLAVVGLGVAAGMLFFRGRAEEAPVSQSFKTGGIPKTVSPILVLFFSLLAFAALTPADWQGALIAKHYQAGALVFGGGHVVLPLLNDSVVAAGLIGESEFLAGYGVAQAMPGPLFTIAAFTGTVGNGSWLGGIAALVAIFLPGMLLVAALLPVWHRYRQNKWAKAGLSGANSAVVGLLLAAFITPVWTNGIQGWSDAGLAAAAFLSLQYMKAPAWAVVLGCGLIGIVF